MLIDARELPEGHRIEADVAIIGGGAAGITLACELARPGRTVALLESGGLTPEADVQDLNAGESVGLETPPLVASRLRYLGGTTNHWTGQCGPMDPIDFEVRDHVPASGWPFGREILDPYYRRASLYCELGRWSTFDARSSRESLGLEPLGFDPADLEPLVYQMSPPTRFAQAWREPLEADGVEVFLYANVLEIVTTEGGSAVSELRCGTLTGRRFTAHARHYVLAAGGIENARILLASSGTAPGGVGNGRDVVGRYFMNHFNVRDSGDLTFSSPEEVDAAFHEYWGLNGARGRGGLRIPSGRQRDEGLLNGAIMLWPELANENFQRIDRTPGIDAFVGVTRSLASRRVPDDFWDNVCLAAGDRRAVASFLWRRALRVVQHHGGTVRAGLQMEAEQAPNPDSRVTLSRERDALGVPRARLDWRPSELDYASIRRTLEIFATSAGAAGLGRYRAAFDIEAEARPWVTTTYHHMGTTRMGTSASDSVVDPDCRVHDVANLYVAGSSVFPTCGRANPTLTLVALAIRLADHLDGIA